jgi:hypothetical protein
MRILLTYQPGLIGINMKNYWSYSGYFLCFGEVIEDLLLCMKTQVFAVTGNLITKTSVFNGGQS